MINKTFLAMMEDLGYDVHLTYEKRIESEQMKAHKEYSLSSQFIFKAEYMAVYRVFICI